MNQRPRHQPVLLRECLELLDPAPATTVVDGTVGEGGHAEAILARTAPDGRLIGLDRDEDALRSARAHLSAFGSRVTLLHASFGDLADCLAELGEGPVDGILLDLGMSSLQLDAEDRGFRFRETDGGDAPLDMRMDRSAGPTARDLLADSSEETLAGWFRELGELPGAHRLARSIVRARREAPIRTATDLLEVVRAAGVGRGRRHHPATLVFQALRMATNDEAQALARVLADLPSLLAPGGRVAVISYHSLEDRAVKNAFRDLERGCVCPPSFPVCRCGRVPTLRRITKRPVRPDDDEVRANPRARSARLRAAERIAEAA